MKDESLSRTSIRDQQIQSTDPVRKLCMDNNLLDCDIGRIQKTQIMLSYVDLAAAWIM